jgi:hypothetical protein
VRRVANSFPLYDEKLIGCCRSEYNPFAVGIRVYAKIRLQNTYERIQVGGPEVASNLQLGEPRIRDPELPLLAAIKLGYDVSQ